MYNNYTKACLKFSATRRILFSVMVVRFTVAVALELIFILFFLGDQECAVGHSLSFEDFLSRRPTFHKFVNENELIEEQSRIHQGYTETVYECVLCAHVCICT